LPSKWTHVIFKLKNQKPKTKNEEPDSFLYYNDLRQFGWIKVVKKDEVFDMPFFKEMGPEFLGLRSGQSPLITEQFRKITSSSNTQIKVLLMDQKRIGGIGNIYANEALFKAGVDPRRKASGLSEKETQGLFEAIQFVLEQGLKYGGSSDENFINILGQEGAYQQHFLVYNRKGQKCPQCDGIVQKIQLGGRGTYYCEKCQR
jgi:formamidopyrimidine-DNA glycosylase